MGELELVGNDLKYVYVNPPCAALHNLTPEQIQGRKLSTPFLCS